MSIKGNCSSLAIRKVSVSTPVCVSFKSKSRASNTGPIFSMVVRIGCPCSPYTSKKRTGQPSNFREVVSICHSVQRFSMNLLNPPVWEIPDKSPFMSAMKQGTPACENVSAKTCKVTVLPVPVAPAIKPWRFAILPMI